jgi:hypothetical protein
VRLAKDYHLIQALGRAREALAEIVLAARVKPHVFRDRRLVPSSSVQVRTTGLLAGLRDEMGHADIVAAVA